MRGTISRNRAFAEFHARCYAYEDWLDFQRMAGERDRYDALELLRFFEYAHWREVEGEA